MIDAIARRTFRALAGSTAAGRHRGAGASVTGALAGRYRRASAAWTTSKLVPTTIPPSATVTGVPATPR